MYVHDTRIMIIVFTHSDPRPLPLLIQTSRFLRAQQAPMPPPHRAGSALPGAVFRYHRPRRPVLALVAEMPMLDLRLKHVPEKNRP